MWIHVPNNASAVLCAGGEFLSRQNEVHAVNARQKGEWTRKVKKIEKRGASKEVKVETAVSFLNLKSVLKFSFL